ncbi:unnamed protein product [Nippostrongylus brasiliensis]|uniref:Odorant response abnormal protein 4 (inferred by orthology to a C. elegans protein) n=1 Tax=Nippostrongylus brasiliensis TaxID=27835 RepID=A0A0N4XYF5_NIPBR|nr:unnamed protein product [Nippostrongylus brasiliensis]
MIVFDRCLESWVETSQKAFQRKDTPPAYSAFFLIGSFCSDGDIHVAHAAACPGSLVKKQAGDALSKTLDDEWIADNAEKVTRILPGGINIVGLAWLSDRKTFTDQKPMLGRALTRIQRTTNLLTTLNINSVSDQMALVFIESPIGKPSGFVIDVVRRGPDSPTKVSFSALEWISVVANASAKICFNVPVRTKQSHFFTEFVAAIRPFSENLMNCPMALVNGEMRSDSEPLFKDLKKKKADSVQVQIYTDSCENKENICEAKHATNLHEVSFDIEIRAAVPVRSNVGSAVAAVKQHLIRNLTARAELQYESMDVVEEGSAAPCSVHQMPRPATTVLYTHPAILLSDYLFEADTVEDAQKNFDELMGLKTSTEHIDEGWERSLEIEEMETVRAPLDDTPVASFKSKDDDIGSICALLVALSVIIAIVGVVVYLVMGK